MLVGSFITDKTLNLKASGLSILLQTPTLSQEYKPVRIVYSRSVNIAHTCFITGEADIDGDKVDYHPDCINHDRIEILTQNQARLHFVNKTSFDLNIFMELIAKMLPRLSYIKITTREPFTIKKAEFYNLSNQKECEYIPTVRI